MPGEQGVAAPVHCEKGILAGCPAALQVPKLILAPPLLKVAEAHPADNIDAWIDDLSVGCSLPRCGCRQNTPRWLVFKKADAQISVGQTGSLTLSGCIWMYLELHSKHCTPTDPDGLSSIPRFQRPRSSRMAGRWTRLQIMPCRWATSACLGIRGHMSKKRDKA